MSYMESIESLLHNMYMRIFQESTHFFLFWEPKSSFYTSPRSLKAAMTAEREAAVASGLVMTVAAAAAATWTAYGGGMAVTAIRQK